MNLDPKAAAHTVLKRLLHEDAETPAGGVGNAELPAILLAYNTLLLCEILEELRNHTKMLIRPPRHS